MPSPPLFDLSGALQRVAFEMNQVLEGEILSRPALLDTDGHVLSWACDVKIPRYDEHLRLVPLAMAHRDILYADVGAAVTLRRNPATARFEIVGFAKKKPGRRTRIGVDLEANSIGEPEETGLSVRRLSLGELAEFGGGFGVIPLSSYALFRGGELVELRF